MQRTEWGRPQLIDVARSAWCRRTVYLGCFWCAHLVVVRLARTVNARRFLANCIHDFASCDIMNADIQSAYSSKGPSTAVGSMMLILTSSSERVPRSELVGSSIQGADKCHRLVLVMVSNEISSTNSTAYVCDGVLVRECEWRWALHVCVLGKETPVSGLSALFFPLAGRPFIVVTVGKSYGTAAFPFHCNSFIVRIHELAHCHR